MSNKDLEKRFLRIEKLLSEIVNWLRIANLPRLRDLFLQELDSEEKMVIFELTDGVKSQKEIASKVRVSRRSVSYYWQKWYGLGILIPSDKRKGRMKKIVSLSQVGITTPRIAETIKESEVIFKPRDLKRILGNRKMFPSSIELMGLALDILPSTKNLSPMRREELLDSDAREELIDTIIQIFKESDKMTQSIFMQALERRAHEKKDTQFRKYFEAWEKQIGR